MRIKGRPKRIDIAALDEGKTLTPVETSGAANVAGPGERLYPQTARESLFEIRRRCAGVHVDLDVSDFGCEVDRVALEGLRRTEPLNFELTDQLADRLAEAHSLIERLKKSAESWPDLHEINEVLALPPDLETIVERHKGS